MEITPYIKDVMKAKICPYCKSKTKTVPQNHIYNKTYNNKRHIICCVNWPQCDSYVGTDDNGIALGRLAKKELRAKKKEAHKHFDILWKEKYYYRDDLYEDLSEFLELPPEYTHIGMFGLETCQLVIDWSIERLKKIKSNE